MRESRKYLMSVPVKFICSLGMVFGIMLALFRMVESRAAAYGPIHEDLAYYVFILALLPAISLLMALIENYMGMWLSETMLARYLRKLGVHVD